MFSYFAWFQLNEGRRKVVSPAAEVLIDLRGFCGPLHWQTYKYGRNWRGGEHTHA
jgi:hypothetical protein